MKQGKIIVPPIKCQGIKTKLIPFIRATVQWNGRGDGLSLFSVPVWSPSIWHPNGRS